jgi:hypothetical protein
MDVPSFPAAYGRRKVDYIKIENRTLLMFGTINARIYFHCILNTRTIYFYLDTHIICIQISVHA